MELSFTDILSVALTILSIFVGFGFSYYFFRAQEIKDMNFISKNLNSIAETTKRINDSFDKRNTEKEIIGLREVIRDLNSKNLGTIDDMKMNFRNEYGNVNQNIKRELQEHLNLFKGDLLDYNKKNESTISQSNNRFELILQNLTAIKLITGAINIDEELSDLRRSLETVGRTTTDLKDQIIERVQSEHKELTKRIETELKNQISYSSKTLKSEISALFSKSQMSEGEQLELTQKILDSVLKHVTIISEKQANSFEKFYITSVEQTGAQFLESIGNLTGEVKDIKEKLFIQTPLSDSHTSEVHSEN